MKIFVEVYKNKGDELPFYVYKKNGFIQDERHYEAAKSQAIKHGLSIDEANNAAYYIYRNGGPGEPLNSVAAYDD